MDSLPSGSLGGTSGPISATEPQGSNGVAADHKSYKEASEAEKELPCSSRTKPPELQGDPAAEEEEAPP